MLFTVGIIYLKPRKTISAHPSNQGNKTTSLKTAIETNTVGKYSDDVTFNRVKAILSDQVGKQLSKEETVKDLHKLQQELKKTLIEENVKSLSEGAALAKLREYSIGEAKKISPGESFWKLLYSSPSPEAGRNLLSYVTNCASCLANLELLYNPAFKTNTAKPSKVLTEKELSDVFKAQLPRSMRSEELDELTELEAIGNMIEKGTLEEMVRMGLDSNLSKDFLQERIYSTLASLIDSKIMNLVPHDPRMTDYRTLGMEMGRLQNVRQ